MASFLKTSLSLEIIFSKTLAKKLPVPVAKSSTYTPWSLKPLFLFNLVFKSSSREETIISTILFGV